MLENMVFDWVYHEHLCYHSIRPLVRFFDLHGLELIDVKRITTKGGSIRCFVQLKGGARAKSPVIGKMTAIEEQIGLHSTGFFHEVYQKIEREKQKLRNILQTAKTQGVTIAGYGASATTTTLVHHFEIGGFMDFIVDDDRLRHDRFSPGHHIPVLSSDELYSRKPGLVVILAWRYAEPILKRHQRFLEEGGRMVVPLPVCREV